MSTLPHVRTGLLRQSATLLFELGVLALLGFVGLQVSAYFESVMLGLIAAGIAFLIGASAWTSGGVASPRRH